MYDIATDTLPRAADLFLVTTYAVDGRRSFRVEFPCFVPKRKVTYLVFAVDLNGDGALTASEGALRDWSVLPGSYLNPMSVLGLDARNSAAASYAVMA